MSGYLLAGQDGVVTRAQVVQHISADRLRHLVESGRWQAPHRGVYIDHAGPIGERQRWSIAVLACRAHVRPSRPAPAGSRRRRGVASEAEFVGICRRTRFPLPTLKVSRRDAGDRQRHLDAYFDGYSVHVEIDGGQHRDVQVRTEVGAALWLAGWRPRL